MNPIENAKQNYDTVPIPGELSERVLSEIQKSDLRRKHIKSFQRRKWLQRSIAAAAAIVILFGVKVNTDTVFAAEMHSVPVIGALAKVLTVHSYQSETKDLSISVDVPAIEMISTDLTGSTDAVNQEIYNLCQQYANEAITRANEYKEAFLATGGTEEEWAAHNIRIQVGYEVKYQSDRYLSVAILGTESWTSAYSETRYYNFDLTTGKLVTLKDLLGENYTEIAEDSIRKQLAEKPNSTDYTLDEWSGVTDTTSFYLSPAGNPVITFDKYEIGPGSLGTPAFEIIE